MSHSFDPYHIWLGIPPDEQPPNHYRLLGIPLFESHPDVIQSAVDQRMAHLKSFALGPHVALSQRLLNEVSKAGVCLLRPAMKLAYDAELRAALAAAVQNVRTLPVARPLSVSAKQALPAPPSEPEFPRQFDLPNTIAAPCDAARVRTGKRKKRRHSTRVALLIIQAILGGLIGLAAACFALFLVNPEHPIIVSLSRTFQPGEVARNDVDDRAGARAGGGPEPHRVPLVPSNDASPEPAERRPAPAPPPPKETDPPSGEQISSPPLESDPSHEAPSAPVTAPPTNVSKAIVLDLTRSAMYSELPEVANGDKAQVQVEEVEKLSTSYALEPSDGVIGLGRPVDIVLTQYPGVRIRLSLVTRGKNAALKVAPQIDVGQGETTDFSQRRLELARLSLRKDANKLDEQLSAARYEAAAIQNWLASPVVKPLQSRRERTTRLQVLKQMIPALEQRMSYAQTRADVLVRLSQLAEQIHDTASIHLVVSLQAEDRAP